ncbi:MAG: transposase [Bacteroidota bacterium]|nr:transposase [Bacteroidota bacterium]
MVIHGQVIEVAFNVQTVVDDMHNLVVEYLPTNRNDKKALLPMALRAKKIFGKKSIIVLADKGYHNGEQLSVCAAENVITFVAVPDAPRNSPIPTPEYYGEKFRYNKKLDTYTCPEGQDLKSNGQWYGRKYDENITRIKHYKTSKCKNCPALASCTLNPKGRILERSEYAESAERNKKRVKAHPEIYAARQQIVEHIFGTIKRQWGYDHALLKGLRKNDGEFGLIYLVYNLRRIINILGVHGIKKWTRKMIFSFFEPLHPIQANRSFEENKFWAVTA